MVIHSKGLACGCDLYDCCIGCFYDRKDERDRLYGDLYNSDENLLQNVLILGQRKIGKSCFLKNVYKYGGTLKDTFVVFLDGKNLRSETDFWHNCFRSLETEIELQWDNPPKELLVKLRKLLEKLTIYTPQLDDIRILRRNFQKKKMLIFIDNFGDFCSNLEFDCVFLTKLGGIMCERNFALIGSSTHNPMNDCPDRESRATLNKMREMRVVALDKESAGDFLKMVVRQERLTLDESKRNQLIEVAGFSPAALRKACEVVSEHGEESVESEYLKQQLCSEMQKTFEEFWEDDCSKEERCILNRIAQNQLSKCDDLMDLEESGYIIKDGKEIRLSSAFAEFIRCKNIKKNSDCQFT